MKQKMPALLALLMATSASASDIVITEIMQNPSAVNDSAGEWFEILNTSDNTINLNGWTVSDNDSDSFTISADISIQAGQYLVLGNNIDSTTNGGVNIAYQYSGMFLSNGADEIVLRTSTDQEVDRVEWDGGPNFPDPTGASMVLDSATFDNNIGSNWSTSIDSFGLGDLGTPGSGPDGSSSDNEEEPGGEEETTSTADIIISGVIDGPLSGGVPKAVELFVVNDIADLSVCGLGSANNGGGTDGQEFTFVQTAASAGDFIYVSSESTGFNAFFGFDPDYTTNAMAVNGDDAIQLFCDGDIVDVFGEADIDGTGTDWEYLDGWAYRYPSSGPDGETFNIANWEFSGKNALDGETVNESAVTPFPIGSFFMQETLIITGVFDGPLTGGTPKFVEFYAATNIADLSIFGFGAANNGGGTDGQEYTFSGSASAGDYLYIASESAGFKNYFGFDADDTTSAASINGDDAIELYKDGQVVDIFGDINTDGTGEPWEYLDGWAYRIENTGPDGDVFDLSHWTFSGKNAVDGETTNDEAASSFPYGSYAGTNNGNPGDEPGGEVVGLGQCADPATLISAIQGTTNVSPLVGQTQVVEAIVTGSFEDLSGFFVQEEDADMDADAHTSEGLFVFYGGTLPSVGTVVRLKGTVEEFFEKTQLKVTDAPLECGGEVATVSPLSLPFASFDAAEALEGMLVSSAQEWVVTNNFGLSRYGQVSLASERLYIPTNLYSPGSPEALALAASNGLSQIVLDDGSNKQNPEIVPYPTGNLSAANTLRSGDTVSSVTGVVDYSFGQYAILPVQAPTFVAANARTAEPELILGNLKIASLNVLNYFNTIDDSGSICGPSGDMGCRGADSAEEFIRQKTKTVKAIVAMDADIVGLMEIENNGFGAGSAIQDLVDGVNAQAGEGTYSIVSVPSPIGTDAITVALIYKASKVTPVGALAILDSSNSISDDLGVLFNDGKNRPSITQKFALTENGEEMVVSVSHLKSKGSGCGAGDDDTTTGQGNCNLTRTRAAKALTAFIAQTFPDAPAIIMGDLNAYAKEDPISTIEQAGYTNLINHFNGSEAYSYVFGGEFGYLDHALGNNKALAKVVDVTEWHINADEPIALDYNTNFKSAQQIIDFYADDVYRMSDHDPVLISLQLDAPAMKGDWDGDKDVDINDIRGLISAIQARQDIDLSFDMNKDGIVNVFDARLIMSVCTRTRCAAE